MERVFQMYQPRLSRSLLATMPRLGFSRMADLEAVVQEAFIRVFAPSARASYDEARDFYPYLETTARNFLLNEVTRRREDPVEEVPEPAPELRPGLEDELVDRELTSLLSQFLAGRPELERTLYRLRFEEQLTQEQAAQRMSRTRVQVRRIETRLRSDLFDFLQERGYLDGAEAPRRRLGR